MSRSFNAIRSCIVPVVLVLCLTAGTYPALAGGKKIPIIHSTDLFHPHDDPDDHYDLATLFALDEFDIKGIVLDSGRQPDAQLKRFGGPPIEQMMKITGRKVPYAIGLSHRLNSPGDKALDQEQRFQAGIELIFSVLRESDKQVTYHAAGSLRNLAAAFNREPELLKRKLKAVYIEIGRGPSGEQREWNVTLDPYSFALVIESGLPVYWCPCFGTDGYATYYTADQSAVVGACLPAVQNFFVYCLTQSKADPIEFLSTGPHSLPTGERKMWCTAPLIHAAGRKIYRRGPDDFVALQPADAAKAGLADKLVEALRFVPMRAAVGRLPRPGGEDGKPTRLSLDVKLNPKQNHNGFIFQQNDEQYSRIMPSVLKNLLAELGK